jgi:hypothetical protein
MKCRLVATGIVLSAALAHGQDVPPVQSAGSIPDPVGASGSCPPSKVWSVTTWGHFLRFTDSVFDWKTAVSPAVTVGLSRLAGVDDGFARNWNGYAHHYGVNILGNVSGKFFGNFALPALFQQDEQFQRRRASGNPLNRISHVLIHAVWAGQGRIPVNVSSLGGNAINAILANTYQPRAQRGVGATAQRFGLGMLLYAGSDAYTEFSPDLWYALKKLGSKVIGIKERSDNNSGPPLPKMAYSGLLAPQGKLASAGDWGGWNSSEQLEFLAGTQALLNWCELESACKADRAAHEPGLEQVAAISKVHGAIANMPSDKQYNIEVAWQPGADKCFEHARGWGIHLAQLHPGMYGYDQNKMNDSLLGLVVLFKQNDSKKGQFHIGFADIPDHYSAEENSNIQKNYGDYCLWYGEIRPYQHCPPPPPLPALNAAGLLAPPPPAALAAEAREPLPSATAQERNNLRETVQQFLNAWYVQADYARLDGFIARDNMLSQTAPASESPWRKYFQEAFRDDPPAKAASLNDAIAYHEMTLPTGLQRLQYLNRNSAGKLSDPFAIVDPGSTPLGSYFPPPGLSPDELSRLNIRAQYTDHLRRTDPGRLYLVVYATKSPHLKLRGVVLYWILEGSDWKLALAQATD